MAAAMRSIMRFNMRLASNNLLRNNLFNSCRFLYSDQSLGIPNYENARLNIRNQFLNVENTFRKKMEEVCNAETSMIFTEDLKSMLHLAQKRPEDIELLTKMLSKFNSQNNEMRFGTFIFGPVVMRTFYYLDEPDLAFNTFKDEQYGNFFDQFMSYQILMCLLFKHGKYAEIRDIYDMVKNKHVNNATYPRNALIMAMAACYKENTPETFEYALNVWKEIVNKGVIVMRRAGTFLTALAINQNAPHIAVEIITSLKMTRYIDIRCLKVLAYARLNRFTEIVPILRLSLEYDRPNNSKELYFKDVIEELEAAMEKENIVKDFELYKLIALLKSNDHILNDKLDDHLCSEIKHNPQLQRRRFGEQQSFNQMQRGPSSFNQRGDRLSRPVLRDLL